MVSNVPFAGPVVEKLRKTSAGTCVKPAIRTAGSNHWVRPDGGYRLTAAVLTGLKNRGGLEAGTTRSPSFVSETDLRAVASDV